MARLEGTNFQITAPRGITVNEDTVLILSGAQAADRKHMIRTESDVLTKDGHIKARLLKPTQFKQGEVVRFIGKIPPNLAQAMADPDADDAAPAAASTRATARAGRGARNRAPAAGDAAADKPGDAKDPADADADKPAEGGDNAAASAGSVIGRAARRVAGAITGK